MMDLSLAEKWGGGETTEGKKNCLLARGDTERGMGSHRSEGIYQEKERGLPHIPRERRKKKRGLCLIRFPGKNTGSWAKLFFPRPISQENTEPGLDTLYSENVEERTRKIEISQSEGTGAREETGAFFLPSSSSLWLPLQIRFDLQDDVGKKGKSAKQPPPPPPLFLDTSQGAFLPHPTLFSGLSLPAKPLYLLLLLLLPFPRANLSSVRLRGYSNCFRIFTPLFSLLSIGEGKSDNFRESGKGKFRHSRKKPEEGEEKEKENPFDRMPRNTLTKKENGRKNLFIGRASSSRKSSNKRSNLWEPNFVLLLSYGHYFYPVSTDRTTTATISWFIRPSPPPSSFPPSFWQWW